MRRLLNWLMWPVRTLAVLLRRVWRWLTSPFRRAAAWSKATFDPPEPSEASVAEAFAHTLQHPADILPHLEELRSRLLWSVVALAIGTAVSFVFTQRLLEILARPIDGLDKIRAIDPTEAVGVYMRVSLLAGVTLAMPVILFQVYRFIAPGLKRNERRTILFTIPFAVVLFATGLIFTYFVMLRPAFGVLLDFGGIQTIPRANTYFGFVTALMFWIGLAFQMPLVIYGLAAAGLVKARGLAQNWRIAVIGMAILAAVVTPTIDPVNMGLVMLPMVALYFLSIVLATVAQRGRERRAAFDSRR